MSSGLQNRLRSMLNRTNDIAVFHDFKRPPYGGGNQFLLALRKNLDQRGYRVGNNSITAGTKACIFNSFNFDFNRLRELATRHQHCLMVHRVDGPISVYRGFNDGVDRRIHDINIELADVTIFQSNYSLAKHRELGLDLTNPVVITNAPDPDIFNRNDVTSPLNDRRVRLVSVSWSDNPRKGSAVYSWLDRNLDFSRYEYTFVGRIRESFHNIRMVAPVDSVQLGAILRSHDIFITASENDPCSNALIEAGHCGLPAVYLKSGGHSELVKKGGVGFSEVSDVPLAIDQIVQSYDDYRNEIAMPAMQDVAGKYLAAMGMSEYRK